MARFQRSGAALRIVVSGLGRKGRVIVMAAATPWLATGVGAQLKPLPKPAPAPVSARPVEPPLLPLHSRDPMAIAATEDPLLGIAHEAASPDLLRRIVAETIARAPTAAEAEANRDEAAAGVDEAKAQRRPTVDLTISSYRVIDRNFGNNPENVIEQARPGHRTDQILTADQLLLDAGGASARVGAAAHRLRSAELDVESAADRVALQAIAAWYDVFTYRSLVALSEAFAASQREVRGLVEDRIKSGVSAPADIARVDSYIASADARLARFRRQRAQAEARFQTLTGRAAPSGLIRAPFMGPPISRDLATMRAAESPTVLAARAAADAARRDADAARSDLLPTLSAGLDAGRYGIYETPRDYDIRARLTIRQRLFGGLDARAKGADARSRAAAARYDRAREETVRDAEIAWSDVGALEQQLTALEATYLASRRSRDTIAERFRVRSGTLFDVIGAEDGYFETAVGYLQALTELDASRYVLLSRTGMLLGTLGLAGPPSTTAPPGPRS